MAVPHMCVCGGGVIPPVPVTPPVAPIPKKRSGFSPLSLNLADNVPPGGQITYGYIVTVPPEAIKLERKGTSSSHHSLGRASLPSKNESAIDINVVINDARNILEDYKKIQHMCDRKIDPTANVADIIKNAAIDLQKFKNLPIQTSVSQLPRNRKSKSMPGIASGGGGAEIPIQEIEYEPQSRPPPPPPPTSIQELVVVPKPEFKPRLPPINEEVLAKSGLGDQNLQPVQQLEAEAVGDAQPTTPLQPRPSIVRSPLPSPFFPPFVSTYNETPCASNKLMELESPSVGKRLNSILSQMGGKEKSKEEYEDLLFCEVEPVET